MIIDNPVVLPIILVAFLVGIGLCLYVILRFLRHVGSSKQSTAREAKAKRASSSQSDVSYTAERLAEWVGDSPVELGQSKAAADRPGGIKDPNSGEIEVFRVLRVGSLGELAVEVEGRRYQKIAQIRDGTVGRRVLLAIQELDSFVGPLGQNPLPELHRLPSAPSTSVESAHLADSDLTFLSKLEGPPPGEGPAERKVDLVGYWRKGLGGALHRGSVEPAAGPKSFIDEIEEMLQLRLISLPDLASRGVHFRSTAAGELRIEVDGLLYDRMELIPEPGIVALLKETIQAWEKR